MFHNKTKRETIEALQTNEQYGLKIDKIQHIQKQYGKNKLLEKKEKSLLVRFFMQFNDFMIFILLAAGAASAFISYFAHGEVELTDPLIILFIVIVNAILGLSQENRAQKALKSLKDMQAPEIETIRGGKSAKIKTEELVPGDIIILYPGTFVPADCRILDCANFKIDESALTGESLPAEKNESAPVSLEAPLGDRLNMIYSGTSVQSGRAKAVVTATGMDTELGKIAKLIEEDSPKTPLSERLEKTGKLLAIAALLICVLIFGLGILGGTPIFDMFMTSISLAVAAIPEGLPAIVTITLALGVTRMAKRRAIIRKLPAVETLGSASVICSDKTGTLTQNKMKVVELADENGALKTNDKKRTLILAYGALCNNEADPTEKAIMNAYKLASGKKIDENYELPRLGEIPFDSSRKLMTTMHKSLNITKGAPDFLLELCKVSPMQKRKILEQNERMAKNALRVIAVAYNNGGEPEKDLKFLGLIGIIDPPRKEAVEAVLTCKEAGIKPVMITGDHAVTASAIAKELGIEGGVMIGKELEKLSDLELANTIEDYCVFARVSPEDKMRIVKAYSANGHTTAMTGDGVNDAPALNAADIGCAMGTGTDVAKASADMILIDDNFATIVEAIKEGRSIYKNIKKAIHFLLSSNVGEIMAILLALILGFPAPLLAIHLLWINLVTDSLPAIALGLEKPNKDIMSEKPIKEKSFFANGLWLRIVLEGLMIGMLSLLAFIIARVYFGGNLNIELSRTMAFSTLSISQLFHAFNMRSGKFFENKALVMAFLVGVLLQFSVIMSPLNQIFSVTALDLNQWLIVLGLSF
ncbi:MAG: cation-translocating P-type ATPase, partial [Defluviitaleaceae bacterium]|nr:cation-translocating P-type ATPase [Defluviitaleaceae bacterium]